MSTTLSPRSNSERGTKKQKSMNTSPAIWLSRHSPTAAQLADALSLGYEITGIADGQRLGALDLRDEGDVKALVSAALGLCAELGAAAIFGVVAAPLSAQLARTAADAIQRGALAAPTPATGDVPVFAAWNVQRTVEGGKPTFEHRCWVLAGHLSQASARWL